MKAKKQKNGIKVLLSLVIAITMIGIPASVFTVTAETSGSGSHTQAISIDDTNLPTEPKAGADPYGIVELVNESFESWVPTDWTAGDNWTQNTSVNHTGDACAMRNATPPGPYGTDVYSTLCVDVNATGMHDVALTYYARTDSYNDLNTTIDVNGAVVGYCNISTANRGSWIPFTVDLSAYDGTIFTLCFNYSDPGNDAQWLLDDVVVTGDNHPTGIDIAVNGLVNLTCGGRYNTAPKYIEASVSNYGNTNATGVPFHFQIYQEKPLELKHYKLWDMESCILNTWETVDNNGDGVGWYWTEQKSYSPTHSWHTSPDNIPTYEAYSNDSLILKDWFHVNSTVDGNTTSVAYLSFAHWCQGEFDGTNPIDYGTIYIINATGRYKVGGPYYDTNGEWEVFTGTDGIDISDWIGQDIKIEFNWIADGTGNYEGWYIDDVAIEYSYTSLQQLVWSDYQYADLPARSTTIIKSQLPWDAIQDDANYYIQVYYANNMSSYIDDYDLFNNEINCSVWFGDVCDGAVTAISAPDDVILDHNTGYVEIPINVTVYNNGTLAEDIPVTVSAQHKLVNIIAEDDAEGGVLSEWGTPGMWVAGETLYEDVWTITDQDYFSPTHSWYTEPRTEGIGQAKLWEEIDPFVQGGLQWTSHLKWNLPPDAGVTPVFLASTYYWDLSLDAGRAAPFTGSSGWTTFDVNDLIANNDLYWEGIPEYAARIAAGEPQTFDTFLKALNDRYGPPGADIEDFSNIQIGFLIKAPTGLAADQGVWFDDFKLFNEYPGATVWTDTKTIHLDPDEIGYLNFTWNTTEYCDYIITANVALDCDIDPSNDEVQTTTRIHEWQYVDDYESVAFDDNTCGLPDDWHIVQECSICPDDHFWWNGPEGEGNYTVDRNDVLYNKEPLNFSGIGVTEAYLNFSTYYYMETDYDYGYVEISNDSGVTWFLLDTLTNNSGATWVDMSYLLQPTVTSLYSPYTGMTFDMPTTFFTENMYFRFRFSSDSGENWKGWYIDDVNLTIFNGTWNTIFFDDMENGDALWTHGYVCYGNHWHNESTFGAPYPGTDATAWWNGENRSWIATALTKVNDTYFDVDGVPGYMVENNMTPSLADGYLYSIYYTIDVYGAGYDYWLNQTNLVLPTSPSITLDFIAWAYMGLPGTPVDQYVEITDGITTITQKYTVASFGADTPISIDISSFSGNTVNISWHWNGSYSDPGAYGFNEFQLANVEIWAALPGPTINADSYYNNVDEKVIFSYDLTHAYEAILHFEQNYSFADENDIGQVEIWTGSEWQPIFVAKGASDWSEVTLDITKYIMHDAMTKIGFRFISNETGQSYGWLVDNVSIDGKVDFKAPTCTASLSPETADGNNGWYKSSVTVTLTADDNVKMGTIYYRINGGSWLVYTAPFTISNDGSYVIDYYAVDSVGNEGAHGSVSFKIDATAPTASISSPQAGYIYFFGRELMPRLLFKDKALIIGGLNAEATASDSISGVYVVKFNEDGTTFAEDTSSPYSAPLPFALFAAHTLTVTAEDFAGNTYTSPGVDYFKVF